MIRLFTALCKTTLEHLSDEITFKDSTEKFRHYNEQCPKCGAKGKLTEYGYCSRFLISPENQFTKETRIKPLRFICESCGKTHALLPANIIPHSPYSLRFKLTVLIAYFERNTTVVKLCECYSIAISTLYAWKHMLLDHKALLLGTFINSTTPNLTFLRDIFTSEDFSNKLKGFFSKHGFSFMQNRPALTTGSRPP